VKGPSGILFVVATPIGNLRDITLRAVECLKDADLVVAEDTRRTRKLLSHLGLRKRLISCNRHNETARAAEILSFLEQGKSVALVSDAGTPCISDPGARLIQKARSESHPVVPVPGPCAMACALSVSGLTAGPFCFAGFLPSRPAERIETLKRLSDTEGLLIFYEAPHRLAASLRDILSVLGDREAFLAREMTKRHETYIAASISDLVREFEKTDAKGEITLVVAGRRQGKQDAEPDREALAELLEALVAGRRLPVNRASLLLARLTGLGKSAIYRMAIEIKEQEPG